VDGGRPGKYFPVGFDFSNDSMISVRIAPVTMNIQEEDHHQEWAVRGIKVKREPLCFAMDSDRASKMTNLRRT
jgi:hypothetical protein